MKTMGLAVKVVFEDPGILDMGVYGLGVVVETQRIGTRIRQVLMDVASREEIAYTNSDGDWWINRKMKIDQTYSRVFITAVF